jgi:hypothetical protein
MRTFAMSAGIGPFSGFSTLTGAQQPASIKTAIASARTDKRTEIIPAFFIKSLCVYSPPAVVLQVTGPVADEPLLYMTVLERNFPPDYEKNLM